MATTPYSEFGSAFEAAFKFITASQPTAVHR
jgi:hypothetical protein